MTKFSDVIGASHAIEKSFWRYGDKSTQGMKDMAEHGATQGLEDELKEQVSERVKLARISENFFNY